MKHISQFIKECKNLEKYSCFKWDEQSVKNFWDFEAAFDDRYFTHRFGRSIVALFERDLTGKARVLDYGAGKGFLTSELLNHGFKVSCFDLSQETTRALDMRFKSHADYEGSFTAPELEKNKNSFDVVFLVEVIEHLDDEPRKVVLKNVYELLRNGGIVIVSTPNREDFTPSLICNPLTKEVYHRWQHVYSWTAESLSAEMGKHGFKILNVLETNLKYEGPGVLLYIKRSMRRIKNDLRGRPQENLFLVATKADPKIHAPTL